MSQPVLVEHLHATECRSALGAVSDALYVLGGKWKLPIIIALREGHNRFNGLQRAIVGISARVLSNELKLLEQNGLVTRTVYDDFPVSVEYHSTEYATTLYPVLEALREWGTMHRKKIRHQPLTADADLGLKNIGWQANQ